MSELEFNSSYLSITPRLLRYADLLAPTHEAAKDLFQQTSFTAFRYRDKYNPALSSLITWTATIMRSTVIKEAKRTSSKISRQSIPIEWEGDVHSISNTATKDIDTAYWIAEIRKIAPPQWMEIAIAFHSGFTVDEIGVLYEMSGKQVLKYYQSERTKLRRKMGIFEPKGNKLRIFSHLLPAWVLAYPLPN